MRTSLLALSVVFAGCVNVVNEAAKKPLLPDKVLKLTPSVTLSLENLAGAALVFAVIDPLAPNWEIETRSLDRRRFTVSLTMKAFTTGGDGEAYQVFVREAGRIARDGGATDYRIAAYSEGLESRTLAARRVAHGVVELALPENSPEKR